MAKRTRNIQQPATDLSSDELGAVASSTVEAPNAHFVLFRLADGIFGFQLDVVGEIMRIPGLAHMPLGPRSLLGLANLHGAVLPVVGLRQLLGVPEAPLGQAMRVIVINRGFPVGFVVDRIERLIAQPANLIEKDDAGAGSINPEFICGVIKGAEGDSTIKILNPQSLLRDEFSQLGMSASRAVSGASVGVPSSVPRAAAPERRLSLISFDVGKQEYALPLDRVREIIQLPEHVSEVPRSETAVLGVVTLRNQLLPLVSLRSLLGLPVGSNRGKVVVLSIGKDAIGVVADRTREILHVDPGVIDPTPALLTRGEGDAEIVSICRLDQGRRLVALLSPDNLFRSDLVRGVLSEHRESDTYEDQADGSTMADEQFIIFRLGDQEYGIPISAVNEIARPPEQIAHLPRAPVFIDGVMNLRGTVVPIIDLRRRFEITSTEPVGSRRILILALGGGKTGFMVDSVSEVLRLPADFIRPAPEVSPEQMRLIGRVANLETQNRMILLIDAAQLLDQIETDILVKFDRNSSERSSKAS